MTFFDMLKTNFVGGLIGVISLYYIGSKLCRIDGGNCGDSFLSFPAKIIILIIGYIIGAFIQSKFFKRK